LAGLGETVGKFIKGNTYFIVLTALILIALATMYAGKIYMATGTETFVFKDTQIYKGIDYYTKNFQSTTFLILVTADDVLDPSVLSAMDDLDRQIRNNPKVANVTGPHTFVKQASRLAYGSEDIPGSRAAIYKLMAMAPEGQAAFVVPDEHHAIMTVELRGNVEEKDQAAVLEDIKSIISWSPMPVGTSAVVTGQTALMLEIQKEMMTSMAVMMATAIVFMVLALWFTFGHASWRLLPLPIVLVGVIYTGGVMGLTGVPLTMVSMAVFPILIGLGVEYAIQFQNRMMEELGSGKGAGDAIVSTIRNIGPPVFYSMMTTCLGFLSILQSPVPMIYDFGLMCLIGIIVCFLTALFLLTSVVYLIARLGAVRPPGAASGRLEKAISLVAEGTTRRPAVVAIAILAMFVGYSLDPLVGVEIDSSTFAPQDLPSVVLFRTLTSIVGYKTADTVVQVKAPDVTSPEAIKWMDDFSRYERQNNPDVLAVGSIASLLGQYNNGALPQTRPEIKRAMDRIPPDLRKLYVDDFMTTAVVKMTVQDHPTDVKMTGLRRIQGDLEFYRPPTGIAATLGGQSMMMLMTFGSLTSDRLSMTAWGGLCVLASLLFVYRGDWVKASVPVLAVMIVTGLSCMAMFLLHLKYTPLSVTLGALTIGIGIDFSILHMERYYEEKAKGLPPAKAMQVATAKIGNAIFSSASTVIAGFGALVMSNFSILSNFGLVTIIDFMLALMSALVIMPPLLVTLDTWQSKRRAQRRAVKA